MYTNTKSWPDSDQQVAPGFINRARPVNTDLHASYQVSHILTSTVKFDEFKQYIEDELIRSMAAMIKEKTEFFWTTLDNGDQECVASVNVMSYDDLREMEERCFAPHYKFLREEHNKQWQLKQKWWPTQYGSMIKTSPIVLPLCN